MSNHNGRRAQRTNPFIGRKSEKLVREVDLTELVLGPLSDQMEKMKWDVLSAIGKVNESAEIIARELARQASHGD